MEISYTKVHLKEPKNDFKYWQTQPYEARLLVLEEIRQEYHQWKYNAQPRFQRVLNFKCNYSIVVFKITENHRS